MVNINQNNGISILDFCDLESWESFDEIISILKSKYDVQIVEENDGPESRVWFINIDGYSFSLHNNPYGNYLKPRNAASDEYLNRILPKLSIDFY